MSPQPTLTVKYTNSSIPSSQPFTVSKSLPPPPTPTASTVRNHHTNDPTESTTPEPLHSQPALEAKTKHFQDLRKLCIDVQAEINAFLTEKMAEEKLSGAASAAQKVAEDMEKEGGLEEEMDEETKKLEEEIKRRKQQDEEEKAKRKNEKGAKKNRRAKMEAEQTEAGQTEV